MQPWVLQLGKWRPGRPWVTPARARIPGCWACPHTPRCAQVCSGVLAGPRCRVGCEAIHSGLSGGMHLWGPPCRSPRQKWDVRFVHDGQAGFHGRTETPDDLPAAGDWTPLAATCPISPAGPRRCFWSQKLGARLRPKLPARPGVPGSSQVTFFFCLEFGALLPGHVRFKK